MQKTSAQKFTSVSIFGLLSQYNKVVKWNLSNDLFLVCERTETKAFPLQMNIINMSDKF